MNRRLLIVAAWTSIIAIAVMTDFPLSLRPSVGVGAHTERLAAYLVAGGLFALAYPRRLVLVSVFLVTAAGVMEALQMFATGRDARVTDFAVKGIGVCIGVATCALLDWRLSGSWRVSRSDEAEPSKSPDQAH